MDPTNLRAGPLSHEGLRQSRLADAVIAADAGVPAGNASRNCGTRPCGDANGRCPGHRAGWQQQDLPIGGMRVNPVRVRTEGSLGPGSASADAL